jgi:chromosome segregation ATPase
VSDAERIQHLEAKLRNTEEQLKTYKDKIDKDDLIRCLRASRDSYLSETYRLKDRIADLEQQNDGLRDDNMKCDAMMREARSESRNLRAQLVRAACGEINRLQRMEVAA